jgi:S-methylmethionine-dependent homocysteine/selenocysteine methylase
VVENEHACRIAVGRPLPVAESRHDPTFPQRYGEAVSYRQALPQLGGAVCVTDGGMETVLHFHRGIDLPCFASFPLLATPDGTEELRRYFDPYVALAAERGLTAVLDTPTWRANADWGAKLGYDADGLAQVNREAVALLERVRAEADARVVVSGCLGPRDDAYRPATQMTTDEAERYHTAQVASLSDTAADLITALTLTYPEEAIGILWAARRREVSVVIAFTVETDGRLPNGMALGEAIEQVDAETDGEAAYFMINCAHPAHFAGALEDGASWVERLGGLRANASRKSHAELDESEELDEGDPAELAERHRELHPRLPNVSVVGGCCGTDHRHVAAIADAWLAA